MLVKLSTGCREENILPKMLFKSCIDMLKDSDFITPLFGLAFNFLHAT